MSWWVYLEDDSGSTVEVERHAEGGTYALGCIPGAELNVTYNYGARFREALPDLAEGSNILGRMLHDRAASHTIPLLERVVEALGTEQSADYWEDSDGNAGHAAAILLAWAREHPDATWRVA